MIRYKVMINPNRKTSVPHKPKKCMGFLVNLLTKIMDIRSRNPFTNRSQPNLVMPYFLGLCSTTFSPIFLNPAHFAITGMYRCISPYTSILFTTFSLYAFNPQLKSCNLIFDTLLVTQLKNREGIVFVMVLSYRFFFQPLTIS